MQVKCFKDGRNKYPFAFREESRSYYTGVNSFRELEAGIDAGLNPAQNSGLCPQSQPILIYIIDSR